MEEKFILWKLFIRNSSKGFTLIELMVSLAIAGILLALTLSLLVSNRKLYVQDLAETEINQNLRASLDIIGTDLKQAGERITEQNFPVIEISSGSNLTVRLNSQLPLLRTCQNIPAASTTANNIPTNCANSLAELQQWQDYRCSLDGVAGCQGNTQERIRAFIHDGNGNGEFFNYDSEDLTNLAINRLNDGTAWQNNYSANSTIYLLVEHRYQLASNRLQMIIDGKPPLNVVSGIQSFNVNASIPTVSPDPVTFPFTDGTGNTYRWWRLQSVKVSLQAIDSSLGAYKVNQNKLTVSGEFFPRNSLSR